MVSLSSAINVLLRGQWIQGLVVNGQWAWGGWVDPPVIYPPDIPGLLCWFSGSNFELPEDPYPVDTWYDGSGNGRDAHRVLTGGPAVWRSQGLNAQPSVSFGGGGITDFTVDPGRLVGDRTIFQVIRIDPESSPQGPFHATQLQPSSPFLRTYVRDGTVRTYANPEVDSGVAPSAWVQVVALWCDSSTQTQGLEVLSGGTDTPVKVTSSWVPSSSADPFHIGGYVDGNYGMVGEIGEILIYERHLTDEELAAVWRYFSTSSWLGG